PIRHFDRPVLPGAAHDNAKELQPAPQNRAIAIPPAVPAVQAAQAPVKPSEAGLPETGLPARKPETAPVATALPAAQTQDTALPQRKPAPPVAVTEAPAATIPAPAAPPPQERPSLV